MATKKILVSDDSDTPSTAPELKNDKIRVPTKKKTEIVEQPPETKTKERLSDAFDNPETDQAVDDIVARESDMVLAVDDMMAAKRAGPPPKTSGWKEKLRRLFTNKWTWLILIAILVILLAVPFTRYKLLGLAIKRKVEVVVIDSQTKTPVSDVSVQVSSSKATTNADGMAKVSIPVGDHIITITKQYYQKASEHQFVGLFGQEKPVTVHLVATGRLVPITILNTISGQPLVGATIHVLNTAAKTDSKGQATIALPTTRSSEPGIISDPGYNTKNINVTVTASVVLINTFSLTPSGNVFYLLNQGGSINVMKADLDGSNVKTVLAGSASETPATTRLIASPDWRYLVLEANRNSTHPALYLINTANDQITEFDSTDANFNLIGWFGDDFFYSLTNSNMSPWQQGYMDLKEYNAAQSNLYQIDQNQAMGTSSSYATQTLTNFFIAGNALVYSTQWNASGGYDLANENDTIRALVFGSQTPKDYQSFSASSTGTIAANRSTPTTVYFAVPNVTNATTTYYQYNNQNVSSANINQTIFNQTNPLYVPSPSSQQTVWSELENGQDVILIGNASAANSKQVAMLSGYSVYGWYTNTYLLLAHNNQLYIMPATGLSSGREPLNIASYYEPATRSNYEYSGF